MAASSKETFWKEVNLYSSPHLATPLNPKRGSSITSGALLFVVCFQSTDEQYSLGPLSLYTWTQMLEESWKSEEGNPVRLCTDENDEPRLVVNGEQSSYVWPSRRDARQTGQADNQPEENIDEHVPAEGIESEANLLALICVLIFLSTFR
ncbi:hypothetical protein ACROYT_G016870 [Oculina patagonica]